MAVLSALRRLARPPLASTVSIAVATAGARTVVCRLHWLSEGGEGGAWGSRELPLVYAAVSRGAGEEVSKQFAASLAAAGPWEHVPSRHLPAGAGESAGCPQQRGPSCGKGPARLRQPLWRRGGAFFSQAP